MIQFNTIVNIALIDLLYKYNSKSINFLYLKISSKLQSFNPSDEKNYHKCYLHEI